MVQCKLNDIGCAACPQNESVGGILLAERFADFGHFFVQIIESKEDDLSDGAEEGDADIEEDDAVDCGG